MAKIEVKLNKVSDTLSQGDVVVINWQDGTQSSYMVYCLSEPKKQPRKMLCSLDGGCSLCGYTDLGDITYRQLQQRIGVQNKVTIIKKENLYMVIQDTSK